MANIRKIKNKKGYTYQVDIRHKGYNRIVKTFDNKNDAVLFAQKIEVKMKKGTYKQVSNFIADSDKPIIYISELIDYFKNNIAKTRYADCKKYDVMYDWWTDKIGNIKVKELTSSMLAGCKQILATEKTSTGKVRQANTINKYIMCLSAVLTYAVKELELIEVNPVSRISLMPKPNGRTRFLSKEEIEKLLNECKNTSDVLYLFVLLALSTGGRYSEILKLSINNIDFQNSQIFFMNTKNKSHRGVYINGEIAEFLKEYISKNNIKDKIFINPKTKKLYYIRGILQEVIEKIGLKDFHIHDLRHTTASYIAMNGGTLLDIAEILGHKSLVMARRYSHLTQKHTKSVMDNVTKKMLPTNLI